jgi:putative transposase
MMKHVNQRYVQYVNRTYERSGTLWEGRFKSCLTQSDSYALACYRYIELNPVRASIVDHPKAYRWSSYLANAQGWANNLVTPHSIYLALGTDDHERRHRYRALVQSGIDGDTVEKIRDATNRNRTLGDRRFEETIATIVGKGIGYGRRGRPPKKGTDPFF